jgi:hypothetical protein
MINIPVKSKVNQIKVPMTKNLHYSSRYIDSGVGAACIVFYSDIFVYCVVYIYILYINY